MKQLSFRGVNWAEISGQARPAKLFFFFGPALPGRQSMYYKICTVQFFLKYYSKINIIS